MADARSPSSKRKEKVVHIRLSASEYDALEQAAKAAGTSISAFVRSLSLEGAGVRPFLGKTDRAVLALLAEGLWAIGKNLSQITRAINRGQIPAEEDLAGTVRDARVAATTVAVELSDLTRRAALARRGKGV
jgi:hypothetical protein